MRKIVFATPIPSSLSSSLQLLLFHGMSENGVVDYLMREEVFTLINYVMYRYIGEILSFRFVPSVTKTSVILNVKEIRTPSKVMKVDGYIELNPFTKSLYSELNVAENLDQRTPVKTYVISGYVVNEDQEYEIRYYI